MVKTSPLGTATEPLHIQELTPGSVCSLFIAAYTGNHPQNEVPNLEPQEFEQKLTAELTELLHRHGVEVSHIESSLHTDKNFALLIYAHYCISDSPDLVLLRNTLRDEARSLGISLRMQRSELFAYMHRV